MEKPRIVDVLMSSEYRQIVARMYLKAKPFLHEEFWDSDDRIMLSYVRAHFTNVYQEIDNDTAKSLFLMSLGNGFTFVELMDDFVEKINGTKAKMGDLIHKDIVEQLADLKDSRDTKIFQELCKSNNEISRIICEFHGYLTPTKIRRYIKENIPIDDYLFTEEELEIIERTKKYFLPNQLAHMLYDEKKNSEYSCNHEINNSEEELKRLLVSTNKDNPRFEIVFKDGMIVDYYKGDIRVKPYNYAQVLDYTKLFCAAYYDEMKACFEATMIFNPDEKATPYELGKQLIMNSFVNVYAMLHACEDIYTQKMIDDSKKTLVKIKETAQKYYL
jgi:hypothetical protein